MKKPITHVDITTFTTDTSNFMKCWVTRGQYSKHENSANGYRIESLPQLKRAKTLLENRINFIVENKNL
jgi:hypothetical protein